jgi:hypothetical protein
LLVLAAAPSARAQFVAPIRYNEGPGIKVTDRLVFHPGLAVEGRFDSNALQEERDVDAAGYLRILGHLDLSTLSPQRRTNGDGTVTPTTVDFRLKTALSFREYFSSNAAVKAQRALELDAGLLLALFPYGVLSFDLVDDFARTVQPRYGEVVGNISRDTNRATAKFKLTPGGGRLQFALAYSMNLDVFEDADLSGANRLFHEIAFNAKWKILPKTAIALDVTEQIYDYYNPFSNAGLRKSESMPLRIYLGLLGLITPMLSVQAKVGYGNGFYDSGTSYNNVLGVLELGFQFGPLAKLKLGYEHLFADAILSNYYTDELIYLGYDQVIASRFVLFARGEYRYRQYQGLAAALQATQLKQHVVTLSLGADYQIKDWIYVGLGYDLTLQNRIAGPTTATSYAPSFTKHQVFGRVGVSY